MDLNDIQKYLDDVMKDHNNTPIPEFEGYSPTEMRYILHFTLEPQSPISIAEPPESDYEKIPILNLVRFLINLLMETGELKLTAKGFLPTKIVKDIYSQGFMDEYQFASGFSKLYKESDSISVNMTRLLAELAGLTKKRKGKLSLTKNGERIGLDNRKLFNVILKAMTSKLNWGYYDGYEDNGLGQFAYGFSLILLSKYGDEKLLDTFYAERYFKAFPQILESVIPTYGTVERYASNCYSLRTFEIFLNYFGLIKIEKQGRFLERKTYIVKTELFDKLIKIRPHNIS